MVSQESDEALVDRCRGGDRGAFRTLIDRYQRPLYNAAYRVLGNVEDARDVMQAAFLEVAERLDGYDSSRRFFSWIYRITLNAALNVLRRNRRPDAADVPEPPVDPESRTAAVEVSRRVQRALMQMSEEHRVALTLRHFSGLSYREMASILEVEEKTVKSRLFEARRRMRETLSDLE